MELNEKIIKKILDLIKAVRIRISMNLMLGFDKKDFEKVKRNLIEMK